MKGTIAFDFETFAVDPRPDGPPVPVGLAEAEQGQGSRYDAWGHTSGNGAPLKAIVTRLGRFLSGAVDTVWHNAKFDLAVAEERLGLRVPRWQNLHDTMLMLFLDDPHQSEVGLKPAAERLLGEKPDERDELGEWLVKNQPVRGVKISASKKSPTYWARYIPWAPVPLVSRYARGDADRTLKLYKTLAPRLEAAGMSSAYDRERRLLPVLMGMEQGGMRVDLKRLQRDIKVYERAVEKAETWLRKRLKMGPDGNLDSGAELVAGLESAGKLDTDALGVTPSGQKQTNKAALQAAVTDPQVLAVLSWRDQCLTCLRVFMRPWELVAARTNGIIYTNWNQVRGEGGGGLVGARTGRLSSTPNFQNIPKAFKALFRDLKDPATKGLPADPLGLPPLPRVRSYVIPWNDGDALFVRDYSQQELRILAHFEDGKLRDAYAAIPWMDVHELAMKTINAMTGKDFPRSHIKNAGFGMIYGIGIAHLAEMNGTDYETAAAVKRAYLATFPGLGALNSEMRRRAVTKQPIRTWGGRRYFCEPAQPDGEGGFRTFDYKLLNVLIQGSAADCTKQALIDLWATKPSWMRVYMTVHDEIVVSAPKARGADAMECLRKAMESQPFDVPMLSEGKWSAKNWAALKPWDVKGERV